MARPLFFRPFPVLLNRNQHFKNDITHLSAYISNYQSPFFSRQISDILYPYTRKTIAIDSVFLIISIFFRAPGE